jgi:hypothetical protein
MEQFVSDLSLTEIVAILILVGEAIVSITPSEKDNSILLKIKRVINLIIPNLKKGGGKHEKK